jgi:L-ribulokinase
LDADLGRRDQPSDRGDRGDQSCAIGGAIFAATAAGLYPDVFSAQKALCAGTERVHRPDPKRVAIYDGLYGRYRRLGDFIEGETK